jgi:hypothetical protein
MNYLLGHSLKEALFRNCIIQFIWWILFFPGFYSSDSFAVLGMAKTGELYGIWSANWALAVKLLSFNGAHPEIVTLIFSQIFSASLTIFVYSILESRRSSIISTVLQLTPLVGAVGITLWHDIPMTAGFFLVSAFLIRARKLERINLKEVFLYLVPGMFLSTFRGNGLPTLFILFFFFVLIEKHIKRKKLIFLGLVFSIAAVIISGSQMNSGGLSDSEIATSWIISDVSCYASTEKGQGFVERNIPNVGRTESWSSAAACTWFSDAKLSSNDIDQAREQLPKLLLSLAKEDLGFLVSTHLKRHKYLVPVPIYGIPNPPFIHSSIEFVNDDINWKFQQVAEKARSFIRVWNYFNFFFAYSGLWLMVIFLAAIINRSRDLLYVGALSLVLSVSLFIVAEISDARYVFYILIAGQIVGLSTLFEAVNKLTQLNSRRNLDE